MYNTPINLYTVHVSNFRVVATFSRYYCRIKWVLKRRTAFHRIIRVDRRLYQLFGVFVDNGFFSFFVDFPLLGSSVLKPYFHLRNTILFDYNTPKSTLLIRTSLDADNRLIIHIISVVLTGGRFGFKLPQSQKER